METANIDHMVDGQRKGFLKQGALLTNREYLEASRQGLRSSRGNSLALVETSPDPLSTKVLRLEGPEELRTALAQAESHYVETGILCRQAAERQEAALKELGEFQQQVAGCPLTEAGTRKLFELNTKISQVTKSYREAEDCQSEARIEWLRADQQLENWARHEGDRRREQTRLALEAAKIPKPVPLSEKLSALKKKVTGK